LAKFNKVDKSWSKLIKVGKVDLFIIQSWSIYFERTDHDTFVYKKRACELNKSHIISIDEDPGLRVESFAVINLRGVSTNKTIINEL
jgi:hypothetical protein